MTVWFDVYLKHFVHMCLNWSVIAMELIPIAKDSSLAQILLLCLCAFILAINWEQNC